MGKKKSGARRDVSIKVEPRAGIAKVKEEKFAVIGLGRFGMALARELASKGKSVIAIDKDRDKVDTAAEFTDNAFVIDELTERSLEETGIGEADVAVIGIGDKIDVSILTTLHVLRLGVKRVIAKATSAEQGDILKMMGAEVVYPEHDMALRIAGKLISPHILEYISLSDSIDIMEIRLTEKIAGMTVIGSGIRPNFNLNIIAIRSFETQSVTTEIKPTMPLIPGDTITVIGTKENISRFERFLN